MQAQRFILPRYLYLLCGLFKLTYSLITHGALHLKFTTSLKFEHNLTITCFSKINLSCFSQSIGIPSMYALHAAFLMKTFL